MNKTYLRACVAFVACLALNATAVAQQPSPDQLEKIEGLVEQLMTKLGVPGLSLAIAHDNELIHTQGFGLSDVENKTPTTPKTKFRTASIAKSMTAVVVLSLVEEGALDLDAEVQEYCPDYPEKRWPLTARQLLGHLGGVRHYKSRSETTSTHHYFSLADALKTFADDPLLHEPGTRYRYTTFGYNLLGSVAEGASEKRFHELLQERVFRPASMKATLTDNQFAIIPNRARGYIRLSQEILSAIPPGHGLKAGELYNAALHDTSVKIPGGGLLSTAPDLVRFAVAVNSGKLLQDSTRRLMWTQQQTKDGEKTKYGLGWSIDSRAGHRRVSHSGGQAGTSTILLLEPETGTSVALMCNLQFASLRDTAIAIAAVIAPPAAEETSDYKPAIKKLREAIEYEVAQKQLPAFSLSLVDDQRVVWAEGFGFQDTKKTTPATASTVYRVGSVSKLFTDIAVMQLVEQGKLSLDTPVRELLPNFRPENPFDTQITLRQMMSHRSGLVRESPVGNYFDPEEPSLAATVASLNDTKLVYAPETKTKYSNAAIAVVGAALEKKIDVSHPEQVRRFIMHPLGLDASSFVVNDAIAPKLAVGWMRTYDGRRFEAPNFLLGTGPAGNLYSSVGDLAKFLCCIFRQGEVAGGRILKAETLAEMLTPIKDANGNSQGFGLGFHIESLDGYRKIGHGGAVYGFSTQLEAIPERKLGVAAASALDGSNGVVSRLCDYALRLMIATQDNKPLPDYRQTKSLSPARAKELVGEYREVNGNRTARISELNGAAYLRRGSYRYRLRSAVKDGATVVDDVLGFGPEVRLQANGQLKIGDASYRREDDDARPEEIPDRWKGLIGEYGWDHNVLYILEDQGRLYALIEWFYYYPLKEVDEDTFEFPNYGLYHGEGLKFKRDASGAAIEVNAAEVRFQRREVGTKDGETFKIRPVKPIDQLRAGALAASPPKEAGDFREADLVELVKLDPAIKLDIRYATTNNFTGAVFYKQPRAFMQRPAAEAVARANKRLKSHGFGLLIHDAYRPWHVTKMFWDATPAEMKDFVANPANGSRHNRGCAVDLTLYDLKSGEPIQMVAGYDEFSPRSFPQYPGGTGRQRWARRLLRQTMEAEGFQVYEFEWWHFDYRDWRKYRIGNATFEEILAR